MSFVHCPSCQRAFDLRRSSACPRCQERSEAKRAERSSLAGSSLAEEPMGALVAESLGCAGARSSAAPREVEADVVSADRESQLPASAPVLLDLDAPADQRIASLVAELAAVVERASTEELLSAERLLARRGLPGLGLGRALAAGSGRAAQLATGVAGKVVSALASPKRQVARFARGLRAALSGHGAPPV